MKKISILFLLCCINFVSLSYSTEVHKVSFLKNSEGFWRLNINGTETPIRGAGGVASPGMLEKFKEVGGNFTRTWGIGTLEEKVSGDARYIDKAAELGVHVMAGIWIGHERHGFNYANQQQLDKQREHVRQSVRKWKDHRGIAMWGLGNEMEGPQSKAGNPAMWKELNVLAQIIHEEDPSRPVMTVIAGSSAGKIKSLMKFCPDIDALGVNSYGAAAGVGEALARLGWTKPFAITEFGVQGFWEAPATSWGAAIEPHSSEKARTYFATHKLVTSINDGKELCLGTFAFLWGWKQEKTSTWFGMYLETMEKLPQVDAMVKAWTGKWPKNRCPKILSVKANFMGKKVSPSTKLIATVEALDPEGDNLIFNWLVVEESKAQSVGGDKEYVPPSFPQLTLINNDPQAVIKSPSKRGAYRLFLTIRDGRGNAATANIPFFVQ
jgi:hypothetical protein